MLNRLKDLVKQGGRNYTKTLNKDHNKDVLDWILVQTSHLPENRKLSERVYVLINGDQNSVCFRGNRKLFISFNDGFRQFCAAHCPCSNEHQSNKLTEYQSNVTEEERERQLVKYKETCLDNFGVDNAAKAQSSKDKALATDTERYGGYHTQNVEIKAKIVATNEERYGGHPASTEEVMNKIKATNLERYGHENTMHIARQAYFEQTGFTNPFLQPEMQTRAKATMLKNHGVEHALQSIDILKKMENDIFEKYGVRNVLSLPEIQDKVSQTNMDRYGREFAHQTHFSNETYAILNNKEAFTELCDKLSIRGVAAELGILYNRARKYYRQHGIEIPKSSYEIEISEFLRSKGFVVKINDRQVIKPMEIDIIIPSHKVGIEFCGLYWHSDRFKTENDYHTLKLDLVNKAGYQLITIFEDEWLDNQELVQNKILETLNAISPIIAEYNIKKITASESKKFLDQYHLQGDIYSFIAYGAYVNNELIAVMTFAKDKNNYELLRYSTNGTNYKNVAEELFATFVKNHYPLEVNCYVDRRYPSNLYNDLGFKLIKTVPSDYWYVHTNTVTRNHRTDFDKKKLLKEGKFKSTIEHEMMKEMGYDRIWDCGQYIYQWKR